MKQFGTSQLCCVQTRFVQAALSFVVRFQIISASGRRCYSTALGKCLNSDVKAERRAARSVWIVSP